ncbi:MAG: four helix bundle protein [Treponema sp.]|nr:four helix bundle protein [Treponema sp.]
MAVQSYKELLIWQKGMQIAKEIYSLVKKLPKEEIYALSDQMRRAAVSIPSNIAEGQSRNSTKEFIHFLSITNGSKAELETQLILCKEIGYLTEEEIQPVMNLLQEESKMLYTMKAKLTTHH